MSELRIDHALGQHIWDVRMLKSRKQLCFSNKPLLHCRFGTNKCAVKKLRCNTASETALLSYINATAQTLSENTCELETLSRKVLDILIWQQR